jgi:hypothetical protein
VKHRSIAVAAAGLAALGLLAGWGCTSSATSEARRQAVAAELSDQLRDEAKKVTDAGTRARLMTGLEQLRNLLTQPEAPLAVEAAPPDGAPRLPPVAAKAGAPGAMFAPTSIVIGFFTQSKNFDGVPGDDGLEVRLQPLDLFGDPTKAVGSYRIEVFAYRAHTTERRGERLGHWFVSVPDVESNRKYYDPVDRSYVFPLLWEKPIPPGTTVIVQTTYYPPAGFQEKLFAQRVVKIGGEAEPPTP